MGWCQEFGVQIHDGCDHRMVASTASCRCHECGVVCHGKFSGCATVWAAGPVELTLRRPTTELGLQPVPDEAGPAGRTNGNAAVTWQMAALSAPASAPTPRSDDLAAVIRSLQSEIQTLNRKIDRVQGQAAASEEAAQATAQAAAELPKRIGTALQVALQRQHSAILDDLAGLREQFTADIAQVADRVRQPSGLASQTVTIGQLDARFEWLVEEVSRRFVTLGNEVVRINRQLSASDQNGASRQDGSNKQRAH
ncbi:MAG: hypothetical protein M3N98_02630 [Actinomycetota bacterium]|nr:hypothetical protein [Actinomycetota bacterium]